MQTEAALSDGIGCGESYDGWCALRGRTRLTAQYEWAPRDLGPLASRLEHPIVPYRWYVEASHTLDVLNGAGLFVRAVDGQDYYNIGFMNRRKAVLVGVLLDLSGFERVRDQPH